MNEPKCNCQTRIRDAIQCEPSGGHDYVDEVLGLLRVAQGQRDDAENRAIGLSKTCDELRAAYKRLHSQVSGYLHGKEWEHWQTYNEPKYAPAESSNVQDEARREQK